MTKRFFDFIMAFGALTVFIIPALIIALCVKLTSKGPVLFWSERVGKNNKIFKMPKFRSMRIDAPQVATHLFEDANKYITPIGEFLRKSSLDEIPQVLSILIGDMSVVGPRPALFNQDDLIELRTACGVSKLKPGLTGWAQINGRDNLTIQDKVKLDYEYIDNQSILHDFYIIIKTAMRVLGRSGISH